MTRYLQVTLTALALGSFAILATPEAFALGDLPLPGGPVPTPGPIAGGGIVWLITVAGAGIYLLLRRGKSD